MKIGHLAALSIVPVAIGASLLAYGALAVGAGRGDGGPLGGVAATLVRDNRSIDVGAALRRATRPAQTRAEALRQRTKLETTLAKIAASGPHTRRSRSANLLAALELHDAALDPSKAANAVETAKRDLLRAIRLDDANDEAKFNLELLLTLRGKPPDGPGGASQQGSQRATPPRNGPKGPTAGGLEAPGTGY
jgi:hypothetical protein